MWLCPDDGRHDGFDFIGSLMGFAAKDTAGRPVND